MIFFDIDTQHDFMDADGALSVPGADEIRSNIERLLRAAGDQGIITVSSGDAHREDDPEFEVFPPHCIEGTRGAQRIFPDLPALPRREIPVNAAVDTAAALEPGNHYLVKKLTYDVFSNPWIESLQKTGALSNEDCMVFGVATDYCVRAAALGLLKAGARVTVVEDAIRGVAPDTTAQTLEDMRSAGIEFKTTDAVLQEVVS